MALGKISLDMSTNEGSKVTENLGYVTFDAMDSEQSENVELIKTFARGIYNLTTNNYVRTAITYEVDLDTL